jgi:hypothetical protein
MAGTGSRELWYILTQWVLRNLGRTLIAYATHSRVGGKWENSGVEQRNRFYFLELKANKDTSTKMLLKR